MRQKQIYGECSMAENKTVPNDNDVVAFLNAVESEKKREEAFVIKKMMEDISGEKATMWGPSIVGFGSLHYRYETGREGDMPLIGFSPRKQAMTLYIKADYENYDKLLSKLGKHTTGKSCLYIKKLADVDMDVLRELITQSTKHLRDNNS
jgi:hypothetical protein